LEVEAMDVTNEADFLACLDQYPSRNDLEVFAFSKRHLLTVTKEVGFHDFLGHDYEVIDRLREVLCASASESSLWGLVFIDLWYCDNFGGHHWEELVTRDPGNICYAIQAAHWVFAVSGADGGRQLAALINRGDCGRLAEEYIRRQSIDGLREWWQRCVLPYTLRGPKRSKWGK
jgi:hypothetical protein